MDEVLKNLWLLLTLAIPGMTTYGTFRLLLVFHGDTRFNKAAFDKIDSSALLTTCMILTVAVLQQAMAIAIEAGMSSIASHYRIQHREYYLLFCERFRMAARGQLSADATRILGNCFTSVNVTVGQVMILIYLVWYENAVTVAELAVVCLLIGMGLISAVFRFRNAATIISSAEHAPSPTLDRPVVHGSKLVTAARASPGRRSG